MIAKLDQLRRGDAAEFGGKAASLGVILGAGLPAPEGLAVSVAYYVSAMRTGEGGPDSEVVRDLAQELLARLRYSGKQRLIVRSSATGEDSASLSYAGQFASRVCGANLAELGDAIGEVWASCTAPHVEQYRMAAFSRDDSDQDLGRSEIQMGLVVQPHFQFPISGLLFTQHPIVAVRGWMLCEYLDVSPEKIVSGEVTPHRCRLAEGSGRVVWERRAPTAPVLSANFLRLLVEGGSKLRELMETEVDIEWGLSGETPCFLQCRPATVSPVGVV